MSFFCVVGHKYLPISNLDEGCGLKKKNTRSPKVPNHEILCAQ